MREEELDRTGNPLCLYAGRLFSLSGVSISISTALSGAARQPVIRIRTAKLAYWRFVDQIGEMILMKFDAQATDRYAEELSCVSSIVSAVRKGL